MRRRFAVLAIATSAILLAACGGPSITAGKVIAKRYTPPHTGTAFEPVTRQVCKQVVQHTAVSTSTSAIETCGPQTQYQEVPHHFPATWQVEIGATQQTRWITVTQTAYRKAVVGKRFSTSQAGT